ncbi:MAG TPA: C1 family peptidase [Spirochaetota bacterium]|nr:C1 family peptidase [Spirochaetota bacterium]
MRRLFKTIFICFFALITILNLKAEEKQKFASGLNQTPEKIYNSVKEVKYKSFSSSELPKSVDLSKYLPKPGMQGQQGSCVAWSSAYAYKSFHEKIERDWDLADNSHLFSPAYIYNQLNGGADNGLYIGDALNLILNEGVCTLATMPYKENDYLTKPSNKAKQEASKYKAASVGRVNFKNKDEVKKILANNNCIVFGMNIYKNFYDYKSGVYKEVGGGFMGGHAMLLIGYDDDKQAYKIINSWSENWGLKGYAWLDYQLFEKNTADAWVMYDDYQGKPDEPPESPVNVAASQGSYEDRVRISWDLVKNANSYIVFRSESETSPYYEIGRTNEDNFFDMNVAKNKEYMYSIISVSNAGESDYSSIAIGFTDSKNIVSGIPQNIQGDSKEELVYLRWDKVEGATGYYIYRYSKSKDDYIKIAESKIPKFKDKKVKVNQKYWYIISSFNDSGESEKSETIQVRVLETQKKEEKPSVPENLIVSSGDSNDYIKVNWNSTPNTDSYYLIRWYSPLTDWEIIGNINETSYNDNNVEPGIIYYYTVAAINTYGYSDYAKYETGFVGKNMSKSPLPKQATASQGQYSDKIIIKWDKVSDASGYYITKTFSKKNDKNFKGKKIDLGPFKTTSFTDLDVTDGYIYTYDISSINKQGLSDSAKLSVMGWTEGTDKNKENNNYYKYTFDSFENRRTKWDYKKFDDKFFKYIDSQFKELDKEIDELEKELKRK